MIEEILKQEVDKGWSNKELEGIDLKDKRLNNRFITLSESLSAKPGASINQACEIWKDTKSAYRLFSNEKVTLDSILEPHQMRTVERMKGQKVIISAQDTTYYNYNKHKKNKDMGSIGKSRGGVNQGLIMHSALALTVTGLPLGLLSLEIWARETRDKISNDELKRLPIEEKESYKWFKSLRKTEDLKPEGTRIVTVCDREGDIYEFFVEARELKGEILVRANRNRNLSDEEVKLWEYMDSRPLAGNIKIDIPKREKESERTAIVEVRYGRVNLSVPIDFSKSKREKAGIVTIDAVWVKESNAPENVNPIEWMLLTNVSVQNYGDAIERIRWYKCRWNIEVYHKVIKSGCNVEECRLQTKDRLIPYITLCSIIAWRLFWMTKINRQEPDSPCTIILGEHEWKALYVRIHSNKKLPEKLPTVREVIRWIGRLGGFLGRKGDKEPGITAIWRGWRELETISQMWLIMKSL